MFSLVQQIEGVTPFPIKHAEFIHLLKDTDEDDGMTNAQRVASYMVIFRKKQAEEFNTKMLSVMDREYRKVHELAKMADMSESAARRVLERLRLDKRVITKHIGQAVGWAKK